MSSKGNQIWLAIVLDTLLRTIGWIYSERQVQIEDNKLAD